MEEDQTSSANRTSALELVLAISRAIRLEFSTFDVDHSTFLVMIFDAFNFKHRRRKEVVVRSRYSTFGLSNYCFILTMVLSILIATIIAPGLLGSQEDIRQSQSKEKREEHRARRCNLIATCVRSCH